MSFARDLLPLGLGFTSLIPIVPFLAGVLASSVRFAAITAALLALVPHTLTVLYCETFMPCVGPSPPVSAHLLSDGQLLSDWLLRQVGAGTAFALFAAVCGFSLKRCVVNVMTVLRGSWLQPLR